MFQPFRCFEGRVHAILRTTRRVPANLVYAMIGLRFSVSSKDVLEWLQPLQTTRNSHVG